MKSNEQIKIAPPCTILETYRSHHQVNGQTATNLSKHAVNNLPDQELVRQVLAGDHQAFAVLIKDTERLVRQIVFKMIDTELYEKKPDEEYFGV